MGWKRGAKIGQGSSASVYLATNGAGELFAVKSTDLSSSALLQKEHSLISPLCSPYVVKSLGFDTGGGSESAEPVFNLFLEYVAGGSVADQIVKQGGRLGEGVIRFYAHEMLQGLAYLHQNRLVHCDIKGRNVLVGEDGLKISDFGLAKWVDSDATSAALSNHGFVGTPVYMAPEVARGEEQSFPADIWALGCTVIEMATGSNPWPEMKDPASALYRIAYSGDVPAFPDGLSDIGKDFLSKCLVRDSRKRWTAVELLKHSFFNGFEEENRGFYRKSPTSVMDESFWDWVQESESSNTCAAAVSFPTSSPADRLGELIRGNFSSTSNVPNWEEDDEWVTVRGKESESSLTRRFHEEETGMSSSSSVEDNETSSIACNNSALVGTVEVLCCDDVSLSKIIINLFRNLMEILLLHFNLKMCPKMFCSCSIRLTIKFPISPGHVILKWLR